MFVKNEFGYFLINDNRSTCNHSQSDIDEIVKRIKGPDNPTCYVFPKDVSSNVHTHVPCAPCMDAITEQVQRAFFIAGVANLLQPEPLINKTKQVRDILELSPSC